MYCPTCKNQLRTRRKIVDYPRGPFGKPRFKGTEEYCWYCAWKDTSGPGAQLKQIIKEHNDAIDQVQRSSALS